jgi:hypothetical protein
MLVQDKIIFVFNKILINFLKEIKKKKKFKLVIKKNFKTIDKKSSKYIIPFSKKIQQFKELFCNYELDNVLFLQKLLDNDEFKSMYIFKNINIEHLFKTFVEENDKNVIASYIYTLYLLSYLYEESALLVELPKLHVNVENILSSDDEDDNVVDNEDDNVVNNEDDNVVDNEDDNEDDNEEELNDLLIKSLQILNQLEMNVNIDDIINDILDDDVKNVLLNIQKLKVTKKGPPIDLDNNLDSLIGDSKIGKLAKEISDQVNLDSLNIENPEDLTKLFNSDTGNLLGNLVQQVGTSITDKISSGELKQEDLVKDAFSLMNKMQNTQSSNPVLNNMMSNMMNSNTNNSNTDNNEKNSENIDDPMQQMMNSDMMKQMMSGDMIQQMMSGLNMGGGSAESTTGGSATDGINPDMMQQMMNAMGGTNAMNQMNPNSREGKSKNRLKKKIAQQKSNL